MMTMLAMTAMLIGAMLGMRFKVFILVPAIVTGSAAILGIGTAYNNSLWSILLSMVLAITALQMGYLGGAIIRFVSAVARVVRKDPPGIITAAQPHAR